MPASDEIPIEPLDEAVDHVRGGAAARPIIEYGDYECPYSMIGRPAAPPRT